MAEFRSTREDLDRDTYRRADEAMHGFSAVDAEGNRIDPARIEPEEQRCSTCEGKGEVAIDFGLQSTGIPRIKPCPDCSPEPSEERDDRSWTLIGDYDFPTPELVQRVVDHEGGALLHPGERVEVVPAFRLAEVERERDAAREMYEDAERRAEGWHRKADRFRDKLAEVERLRRFTIEEATSGKPFEECSKAELLEACRWFWISRDEARAEVERLRTHVEADWWAEIGVRAADVRRARAVLAETEESNG